MVDQYKDVIQESVVLTSLKFGGFADEVAGAHTVPGIRPRDKLLHVFKMFVSATVPTFAELTSEFTISADNTVDNTGGTTFADSYGLVVWLRIPPELG